MKKDIFSEKSGQLLFTLFDSVKYRKKNIFRIHNHTITEIGHILDGEGTYNIENKTYTIKSTETYLVRSGEQHCIPTVTTDRLQSINLHITPYYIWDIFSDYATPASMHFITKKTPINHKHISLNNYFIQLYELLYAEDNFETRAQIRRLVFSIILKLNDQILSEIPDLSFDIGTNSHISSFGEIQDVLTYINNHYTEKLTINTLASIAKQSRSVFSYNFKNYTGMSVFDYILDKRIEHAIFLLKTTNQFITQISLSSGFSTISNFNRQFKKITGRTPREYRNKE